MAEPPLPREIQVEVTGSCNLSCRMCLVRYRPKLGRAEGAMEPGLLRRLLDELPDLEVLTLQGLGEPLLAPDLVEMVREAAARGVRVGFNSNGMLLTRRRAEELVAAGLDWLHVSIDGATQATYEGIREGVDLATVTRNVRDLIDVIRRRGARRPRVSVVVVAMRRNLAELAGIVRLAGEMGVPRVRVQGLSHSFDDAADGGYAAIRAFAAREALWDGDPAAERAFAQARAAAEAASVDLRLPRTRPRPPARAPGEPGCEWPWRSAYVTHRGEVQPCCMVMGADRVTLGNARDGLGAVWTGRAYEDFRAALSGGEPPSVCAGCSLYRGVF